MRMGCYRFQPLPDGRGARRSVKLRVSRPVGRSDVDGQNGRKIAAKASGFAVFSQMQTPARMGTLALGLPLTHKGREPASRA
jgi:hypothetical protein